MSYGVKVVVWGEYALFSQPAMKVERVSYDIITPSAARGILEAIVWKPAIRWVIDRIAVCSPIRFTNVRRNEVSSKLPASSAVSAMNGAGHVRPIYTPEDIQQRAAMVLKDVCYVIEAHFEMTGKAGPEDTPEKFYNIALRRIRSGQFFHQPCFGCREFPAHFKIADEDTPPPIQESRDFGFMLYDLDFSNIRNITPMFYRAIMEDGIVDLTKSEVVR